MTELEQYIEQSILPQYDAFDGGHKRDHAEAVIRESLVLAREHGADEQMAYVIAAYHDLGLRYDRETHHIRSGEILMADSKLRKWFTEEQLLLREPFAQGGIRHQYFAGTDMMGLTVVAQA